MRSTFYGFEIAKTGLFAAQRSIDLTGHNISNANTVGYTRQRLILSSQELISGNEKLQEVTKGYSGAGVRTDGVEQVRSDFLDRQLRTESSSQQMWSTKSDALGYVEQLFNEVGDSGLSVSINDLFTSLNTLASNPESQEYRTNVKQNALKLTDDFQHYAAQLLDKQSEMNDAVNVSVMQVNDIAHNIADLNDQIFRFELSGDRANDLRDKRNVLLDNLAQITDITYSSDPDGQVEVQLGGKVLISKSTVHELVASPTVTNPITSGSNLYGVTWSDYVEPDLSPSPLVTTSGKLKGYLDMRDGDSDSNIGIPYLMHQLDTLASTIATQVNTQHQAGYTMPDSSNGNTSVNGVNFFTPGVPITAANISVDNAILTSVFNIATAGSQITSPNLVGDNQNAIALADLINKVNIPVVGSIEGYLKSFVSGIGVVTSHTDQMKDSEQTLVDSLSNQRSSVSGVSVDEEMTNLIKFQHSYDASARMITTIDETLDVLINKLGLVGR